LDAEPWDDHARAGSVVIGRPGAAKPPAIAYLASREMIARPEQQYCGRGGMEDHELKAKLETYTKESGSSIAAIASQIGIAPVTLRRFLQNPAEVSSQAVDKIADFVEGLG
jgi:hypothetical protein